MKTDTISGTQKKFIESLSYRKAQIYKSNLCSITFLVYFTLPSHLNINLFNITNRNCNKHIHTRKIQLLLKKSVRLALYFL